MRLRRQFRRMSKYTIKTELSNVIKLKDGSYNYNEKIVSMHWTPQDEYSPRKRYQLKEKSLKEK
jgi:hypothetical protein